MKFLKIAVLFLTLGLGLSACQKDYDATPDVVKDPTQNPFSGTFSCSLNGKDFNASVTSFSDATTNGVQHLVITGTYYTENKLSNNQENIVIAIPVYSGAKDYSCNSSANITIRKTYGGITTTFTSQDNSNYIVKVSGSYKGTFSTVLENVANPSDKIVLDNGKFEVKK